MSKLSAEPLAGDAKPPVGNAGGDDHRSRDERAAVREPQPIGVRGGARHHVQRAADAYYVTDIVLSIHARTAVGSAKRTRCLDLLDRLIEAGAAEANKEADDAAYAQDLQ